MNDPNTGFSSDYILETYVRLNEIKWGRSDEREEPEEDIQELENNEGNGS